MTIKQLQKLSYQIAKEKGFWNIKFNRKNFNMLMIVSKLMLIVTEISEALEGFRKGGKHNNLDEELADAIIRIFDLAEKEGINLETSVWKKINYNKKRLYRHGKKF